MDFHAYLEATLIIDYDHPAVAALAAKLAEGLNDKAAITKRCFTFVRDEIAHTGDAGHTGGKNRLVLRQKPPARRTHPRQRHPDGAVLPATELFRVHAGHLLPPRPQRRLAGILRLVPHRPAWQQRGRQRAVHPAHRKTGF